LFDDVVGGFSDLLRVHHLQPGTCHYDICFEP
jgi:hypothetical protein